MAGIAGCADASRNAHALAELGTDMLAALRHRGAADPRAFVAPPVLLAQTGTGVFDGGGGCSPPLSSPDGRLWLVIDGDVCNYPEIARDLRSCGRAPRSDADAEVVLRAYEQWGVQALDRLNGSFALAIWDDVKRTLLCARDRFGLKPLHYWHGNGCFLFASEPKALFVDALVPRRPNDRRVLEFLAYGLVDHTNETMFDEVMCVPPGGWVVFDAGSGARRVDRWYRVEAAPRDGTPPVERLRELLLSAVSLRLRGNVDVGVGVSGGVDSSSVLALAARLRRAQGEKPPASFTARTVDPRSDEWQYVQHVVRATGSRNFTVVPSGDDARDDLDEWMWLVDEPVHSLSVYGHFKVMQLAAQHGIRVLLEGQGGDDAFSGIATWYPHVFLSLVAHGRVTRAVHEARARAAIQGVGISRSAADFAKMLVPNRFRSGRGVPGWLLPEAPAQVFPRRGLRGQQRFELEALTSSRREVDRNSAYFGVQARAPFFDHRVVEYGFSLPAEILVRDGWQKAPVRDAMRGIVPREVLERRDKQGFTVEATAWLRGPLGAAFEQTFSASAAAGRPYWDVAGILRALDEHRSGAELSSELWRAYAVERWLEIFVDPAAPSLRRRCAPSATLQVVGAREP